MSKIPDEVCDVYNTPRELEDIINEYSRLNLLPYTFYLEFLEFLSGKSRSKINYRRNFGYTFPEIVKMIDEKILEYLPVIQYLLSAEEEDYNDYIFSELDRVLYLVFYYLSSDLKERLRYFDYRYLFDHIFLKYEYNFKQL